MPHKYLLQTKNLETMTLAQKSIRLNLIKRLVYLFVVSLVSITTYAQVDSKSEDWWTTITKKHDIKFDSYTLRGDYFIIGEKKFDREMETFKDVIVISKGQEDYWIFKSETASYDPNTTTLKIYDCTMEKFKTNSNSLEPEKSYKHINYSDNFEKKVSTMADVIPEK